MTIVAKKPKPIWVIEGSGSKHHYFCSKECAEENPILANTASGNACVCENCSKPFDEMDIGAEPLVTNCEFCGKEITTDSSCAGIEMDNPDSRVFYFCSQEHATVWGNQDTGTSES